ncbi:MAG: hypothetical protein V2I35_11990 [Desulfocapsaceae bacterium]|jgi:hypothetical protein|nr:hypothetical protein [Desulfocapsaceae bacterium]
MSFRFLYLARIGGAASALLCAGAYLAGYITFSLIGFAFVGIVGGTIGVLLNRGTLPALCDLCGKKGVFGAEYGHGFRNARLILDCPRCGRVVNRSRHGLVVEQEQAGKHH